MKRASFHCRAIVRVLTLCLLSTLWGCSEIRLNTLPAPPPTAKLRVFVLPITSTPNPRGAWMPSERDFSENQYRKVARILERKGIYRVIPEEEARAATAGQSIEGWQWARGNWNLAKEAGRALHADYVLIFERKFSGAVVNKLVFLSLRTDKAFEETLVMPGMAVFRMDAMDENREMIGVAYQKIFMAAKGDMFLTAIQKGRAIGPSTERKAPEPPKSATESTPPAPPVKNATPPQREMPEPVSSLPVAAEKDSRKKPAHTPSAAAPSETKAEEAAAAVEKEPPAPAVMARTPATAKLQLPDRPKAVPAVPPPAEKIEPKTQTSIRAAPPPPEKTPDRVTAAMETRQPPPAQTETAAKPLRPAPPPVSPPAVAAKAKDVRTGEPGNDKLPDGLQAMIDRQQAGPAGKSRLVVYDFEAGEQLNIVAMILSEALREELHELGKFLLVNRENIVQVMDELKLQQSGMVDDRQAVRLGKWLAANETVTGKLALIGNLYVLQAKRTDIQSLRTLGIGSLKSSMGKEEELLNSLPSLARKLAGLP